MQFFRWPLVFILSAFTLITSVAAQNDVRQLAQKVDSHYNGLITLKADYTEIYRGAGVSRTESGTLWLKRPGRMRWEYRAPREKLPNRRQDRLVLRAWRPPGPQDFHQEGR
jgi:outer membrane lipoprotein-sorting protein